MLNRINHHTHIYIVKNVRRSNLALFLIIHSTKFVFVKLSLVKVLRLCDYILECIGYSIV